MKKTHHYSENQKKLLPLKLFWICSISIILLALCGCGNGCQCLQNLQCESETIDGVDYSYHSVPLCGGCISSEYGCNSCLWGENCNTAKMESDEISVMICSEYYYGDSCVGCGSTRESVYVGSVSEFQSELIGCYCGSTNSENEYICGYLDGCVYVDENDTAQFYNYSDLIQHAIEWGKLGNYIGE